MRRSDQIFQKIGQSEQDAETYSPQVEKLMAEWEQDRAMARERDETGKEPARRPFTVERATAKREKPIRRERIRSIDIPF